jgi:hypothetical protein
MNKLMPFLMALSTDKSRQQPLLETEVMNSLLLDLNPQQSFFSVVTGDQRLRVQQRDEERLVAETASAVARTAAKPVTERTISDAELGASPKLNKVVKRNVVLRQQIDASARSIGQRYEDNLASEAVELAAMAIAKSKDTKLTFDEMAQVAPNLGLVIGRLGLLDDIIDPTSIPPVAGASP